MRKRKKQSSYKERQYFHAKPGEVSDAARKSSVRQRGGALKKNTPKRAAIKMILIFSALLLAGALLSSVGDPKIQVAGASPYDDSTLQTGVDSYFEGGFLRGFRPFISAEDLTETLRALYPDIASAEIHYGLFSRNPEITLTMRQPSLIWRNQDGQSLVVDVQGVAYASYDKRLHGAEAPYITDATQPLVATSTPVLSPQMVQYILSLDRAVQSETTIKKRSYVLPLSAREIQLRLKDYDIRFSLDRFEEEQAQELALLLSNLKKRGVQPSSYIDLRAEDRAYYR